jgi:DNA-dependent RNA polymerase
MPRNPAGLSLPLKKRKPVDTLAISEKLTKERFARRNQLKAKARKRYPVIFPVPLHRKLTLHHLVEPLARFLGHELNEEPYPPPGNLGALINQLEPVELSVITLTPLLDGIMHGWNDNGDLADAERELCERIGQHLHDQLGFKNLLTGDTANRKLAKKIQGGRLRPGPQHNFLKSEWNNVDSIKAGHWLLECALSLGFSPDRFYFPLNDSGFPTLAPEWRLHIEDIRDELLWRNPIVLPHTTEPPDWTGWRKQYTKRLEVTFVRDWRPETKVGIDEAFCRSDFGHARGVDALKRVPLRVDKQILTLVDRFAVEVIGHADKKRKADWRTVKNDIRVANYLGDGPFWLDYNCDKRGRVFSTSHFNYSREDHVRSIFKFAHGMPLQPPAKNRDVINDLNWLEIHCANCQGDTDKKSWTARVEWAAANRTLIEKIADDPAGTFDLWRDADKPFAYAAACLELTRAWTSPADFVTHLPIGFDGTCSGIQHLCMIARDGVAGRLVNLTNADEPRDIYSEVIARVMTALETDDNEFAQWWRDRLKRLKQKHARKLLKTPIMTFAYSATPIGMADKITEVYDELFRPNDREPKAMYYLAKMVMEACKNALPGPAKVMDHIRALAEHYTIQDRFLEWRSPTGYAHVLV